MQHDQSYQKQTLKQALDECAAWIDTLNLLQEESDTLKTTMSEALDNNADKDLVTEAENFHNLIITRDEYIRDITADAKKQEKKLQETTMITAPDRQWVKPQQKLRNEIARLEKDFFLMKKDFQHKFLKKATS